MMPELSDSQSNQIIFYLLSPEISVSDTLKYDFVKNKVLDFDIVDEGSKEKYIEWEKIKKTYFEAKLEHEKRKAIEKYI